MCVYTVFISTYYKFVMLTANTGSMESVKNLYRSLIHAISLAELCVMLRIVSVLATLLVCGLNKY